MAKPMITAEGGGGGSSKAGTTYVQADSTCFRDLVQRLTGPSAPVRSPAPKSTEKLHERRKCYKPKIEIGIQFRHPSNRFSPCSPSLSSSRAGPNKRASSPSKIEELLNHEEEEKAIKEKRFYLHPSPRSKPRLTEEPEAQLLTLFPPRETS